MSKQSPQDQLREYLEENFNNVVDKGDKYIFDCHCEGVDNKGKGVAYKNNPRFTFCSHEPNNGIPTGIKVPKKDFVPDGFRKEKEASFIAHGLDIAKLQKLKVLDLDLNIIDKESPKYLYYEKSSGKATWRSINKTSKKKLNRGTGREIYSVYGKDKPPSKLYVFAGEWDMLRAIQDGLHRGTTRCTSPFHGESIRLTKKETIETFQRHEEIIFCYDNDKAGVESIIKKMADLPRKLGKKTKVGYVELQFGDGSHGTDYCDWRKNHSVDEFRKLKIKRKPPKPKAPKKEESKEAVKKEDYTPKPQFIEKDNQTFYLKIDKKHDTSEYIPHASFTMRIIEKREDDEGRVSYLLDVKNRIGERKKVEITEGSTLVTPNRFDNALSDMGFFTLYDQNKGKHTRFVEHILLKNPPIEKYITQYIGAYKPGEYLYNNAIVTKDGVRKLENIIPPKTKVFLHMPKKDVREYWREKLDSMKKVYGKHTWKIIGFCVASIWSREIFNEYNSFPILKIGGGKGSGKSSLSYLITSMFGGIEETELKPRNATSTKKSYWRDAEKFNSIPLTINEYKGTPNENQMILSTFDREGVHRAKTTNDLQTHSTKVNCTMVVISTREISGYESAAATSRCVDINLKVNPTLEDEYQKLSNDKCLSSLPVIAMKIDVKKLISDINTAIVEAPDNQESIESRNQRNHTIFLTAYLEFARLLGKEVDFKVEQSIMLESMKDKESSTDLENYGIKFISHIVAEISKNHSDLRGQLAEIDKKGDLYFKRLGAILDHLRSKKTGDDLPGLRTVTRDLNELSEKIFRITVKENKVNTIKDFSIENKTFRVQELFGNYNSPFKGWKIPGEILENLGIIDDQAEEEETSGNWNSPPQNH